MLGSAPISPASSFDRPAVALNARTALLACPFPRAAVATARNGRASEVREAMIVQWAERQVVKRCPSAMGVSLS